MAISRKLNQFNGCTLHADDLSEIWGFITSNIPSTGSFSIRTTIQDEPVEQADLAAFLQHPSVKKTHVLRSVSLEGKSTDKHIKIQIDQVAGVTTQVAGTDRIWNTGINTKLEQMFERRQPSELKVRVLQRMKRRWLVSSLIGVALALLILFIATSQTLFELLIGVVLSISWVWLGTSYYEWSMKPALSGAKIVLNPVPQSLLQRRAWEIAGITIALLGTIFALIQVIQGFMKE